MSPSKKDQFANLPRRQSLRLKTLNSPTKYQYESDSSTSIQIKSEPSICEEETTSKRNNSDDEWGSQEMIPLKDLRARCKANKKRKNRELKNRELDSRKQEEGKFGSDLDEPLILLKVKRSKNKNKNKGINVISQCVDGPILPTGIYEKENPREIVKSEPVDPDISIDSSNLSCIIKSEILENEGDQIVIFPSNVDFIANFDPSSPEKSSYSIWPANHIAPGGEKIICSINESCTNYLISESEIIEKELNQFEGEKKENMDVISESSEADCVNLMMDGNTESKGIDHGFFCEETPDFLNISSFGSTDGQLESIVYNAITPSNPNNNNNEFFSNSGEEKNLFKVFETQSNGVLQLCNNLEKEQSEIIEDRGAELQKADDQITREESGPIKLLSNRNIISPISQEKLCHALTDIDTCDGAEFTKCKKRILFENWTKSKKPPSESTSIRNLQKSRGIIAKVTSNNSPVKMDTQKAIDFSQRQMKDFENIANKLLKSMKFMKNVLDESLNEDSQPLISKFGFTEIQEASDNASELDKMTKKWLNIMSKDCNRFCKILRSAGDMSSSSPVNNNNNNNENKNKRRKIVFADEAGGELCQIRVFSQTETQIENPEQ